MTVTRVMIFGRLTAQSAALAVALMVALLTLALAPLAGAQAPGAMVRVAHLSPDAPAVDVYVNGQRVLSNVAFGAVSNYLNVPAGKHAIKVLPAGAPAADKGVIEAEATVEGGKAYTVAAMGQLANIGPVILVDDLSAPAAGKAKVRVVHASPNAPAVDVAVKGGPVLFSNAAFKAGTPYAEVNAGRYDLEVRPTGTTTVALAIPGVAVETGTNYTVFAIGLAGGQPPLSAKPVVDAKATAAAPAMPRTGAGGTAGAADTALMGLGIAALGGLAALTLARRKARQS